MEKAQSFIFDAGWIFFGGWSFVLAAFGIVTFGRDLLWFNRREPGTKNDR
jgi:hypothetical protein